MTTADSEARARAAAHLRELMAALSAARIATGELLAVWGKTHVWMAKHAGANEVAAEYMATVGPRYDEAWRALSVYADAGRVLEAIRRVLRYAGGRGK